MSRVIRKLYDWDELAEVLAADTLGDRGMIDEAMDVVCGDIPQTQIMLVYRSGKLNQLRVEVTLPTKGQ